MPIYCFDKTDWFAGATPDDAKAAAEELYGDPLEYGEWEELPPDKMLSVGFMDHAPEDGPRPEGCTVTRNPNSHWEFQVTATAEAWENAVGRGFVASTEF